MKRPSWIALLIFLILATPIAVYVYTFGARIYDHESAWATMGAAMSGLYGPIVSVLTLAVLLIQVQLQRQTTEFQRHDSRHLRDDAHIQVSRADIEFYLSKLDNAINRGSQGKLLRHALHVDFAKATVEQLKSAELRGEAALIDDEFPQVNASWASLNTVLKGLEAEDRLAFQLQLVSAQQKAVAILSYATCASLDNYLYCLTQGQIAYPCLFSTSLPKDRNL